MIDQRGMLKSVRFRAKKLTFVIDCVRRNPIEDAKFAGNLKNLGMKCVCFSPRGGRQRFCLGVTWTILFLFFALQYRLKRLLIDIELWATRSRHPLRSSARNIVELWMNERNLVPVDELKQIFPETKSALRPFKSILNRQTAKTCTSKMNYGGLKTKY